MFKDIILNSEIEFDDKYNALLELIKKYREIFTTHINNYDFNYIAIPAKWGKKVNIKDGMAIYNYITNSNIFSAGSSGKYIYTIFHEPHMIKLDNIDFSKHDMLVIPYKYDIDNLKSIMEKFKIRINVEKHFGTIFVKACDRIVEIAKTF